MSREIKSGIGYIIPAAALVGYAIALYTGLYLMSIVFAVIGILGWFLYLMVLEVDLPHSMGNLVILFAVLLAIGVFMAYGLEQDMFGGYVFRPEGAVFSLVLVMFGVLGGVLFNRSRTATPRLTSQEEKMVQSALEKGADGTADPKVIVIKQEAEKAKPEPRQSDPRYAYPYMPEDYYEDDDDEEDENEDEWDEEWEEDDDEEPAR